MKNFRLGNLPLLGIVLWFLFVLSACSKDNNDTPAPAPDLNSLYAASIKDAMTADSSEIIDTLWPITASNTRLQWKTINGQQYVLMATFMRFPSSYPQGDSITTTWGEAWLFVPAQMKQKLSTQLTASTDTLLRVCELLGLPPINPKTNTHIAQMWVPTSQLFRPAGNPDITATTTGPVPGIADNNYLTWFNNYIIYAYYHPLTSATDFHYPWTRLGYTYDWAPNGNKVGLSEFVMKQNTGCWVEKTTTAQDFFKN
ncbi:hypothetical protein [Chitinophaga sp. Cy-1792]|uniref:hypothetical protein n=1 Tax=Chitinophaga sp. Cy-1792 TaxID=2608339 RepID=UPI0014249494|nr:hypothetical protein [Chitinophaga sp. Cy-1792]NIG56620.1 hypothetical protein [Chitinophaga sp. Cy-1792]